LRAKVLCAVDQGKSRREIVDVFGVSLFADVAGADFARTSAMIQESRFQPNFEKCGSILTAFSVILRANERSIEMRKGA
jgi:hypothetical protein